MKLSELNETIIPMRRAIGPKGHQVEIAYGLNLGKMTLKQQIVITGLADAYKRATDNPTTPSYVDGLFKKLCGALLPVLAEWDLTDDDETPLPLTADTLAELPGPAILAMGLSVFELISYNDPDAAGETSG